MSKAYKLHPSYFINRSHKNGVSFLQYAIQNNKIHIAHEFIIDGFPIDNIDSLRHTAMSDAIMANEPEIIMDLLKHGVSANKICIWVDNATPQSPLQFACTIGASDIVRILIENGASINGGDSVKHTIPIQIVLDHLIKGSILQKFDPRFSTNKNKFLQTFYLLLKYGSNINVTDGDHESMLFEAIRYDNRNMVNILINNGVNVDVKNNRDENPIEIAKSWHHNDLIKLLTQHK
jgi:ankyrin repeat protein